jgi:hypothetical protein
MAKKKKKKNKTQKKKKFKEKNCQNSQDPDYPSVNIYI